MFKTSKEELQYGCSPETVKPPLKMLKSTPDLNRIGGNNCSEVLSTLKLSFTPKKLCQYSEKLQKKSLFS